MSVLLLSTYDLGRQPFGIASAAAWLRQSGIDTAVRDLSRDELDEADVCAASTVGFYLPMHTATRLAVPIIDRVRALNPSASVCAFGLYAPLNEQLLRDHGVAAILGPEFEADLVDVVRTGAPRPDIRDSRAIPRLELIVPDRAGLPPPSRYATVQMADGARRVAGATDATRGCKHRCRHCPIVPVYDGRFRVVPADVVLQDIDRQVAAGAAHITFGDPDFFNGPTHARRIVERLHQRYPGVTYDVTIKVEHLVQHARLLPLLAATGCLFVTSAVESVDDAVLERLEKRHTRQDFIRVAALCRESGLVLVPTFVAFTPWTTLDGYRELIATVAALDLIEHVAPVQWGIRLLVTEGSRLLELEDIRARVQPFDRATLTYPWRHDDPRVDALQADIMRAVGVKLTRSRREVFRTICELSDAYGAGTAQYMDRLTPMSRASIPYLNEPWYC